MEIRDLTAPDDLATELLIELIDDGLSSIDRSLRIRSITPAVCELIEAWVTNDVKRVNELWRAISGA